MAARTSLPVVALLLAMVPSAAGDPYGGACDTLATYDPYPGDVQCLSILAPGGLNFKSVGGVRLGVCSDEVGSPLPCNDPAAPASGFGAAIFDSGAVSWTAGPRYVFTWIEYVLDGVCGPASLRACGFDVLLCNDRDYDAICTDTLAANDQLLTSQSNEALVNPPLNCADADKDQKNCDVDDLDAWVGGCLETAIAPLPDWNYGQVVVFVAAWVDAWPGTPGFPLNIGAGVAVGRFDVWLASQDGCAPADPAQCEDGIDNDGDGAIDMGVAGDAECFDPVLDDSEAPACANGVDDDFDVLADLADPDCAGVADDNERA